MTGLGGLPATCELTALPLPVGGGDRSPVRAFARSESAKGEDFSVDQLL
jgi:kynurenine formamidase